MDGLVCIRTASEAVPPAWGCFPPPLPPVPPPDVPVLRHVTVNTEKQDKLVRLTDTTKNLKIKHAWFYS